MPASRLSRLEAYLSDAVGTAVELERPADPAHGDYATNAALRAAPAQRRSPRELGAELAAAAARRPEVERAEVAGPGFVNLFLTTAWFREALAEVLSAGDSYGSGTATVRERVQVELVSANPTGPLSVGSARNGAYGDSVARLLRFAGHRVEEEFYVNDVGRQVDLFRESVEARRQGRELPPDGYRGAYLEEIAAQEGDPVALMLKEIERELAAFRISIDSWRRQQELEASIAAALDQIDTYEAEGTVWARTSAHGDDKDRALVRAADGSYLYFAADVAYLRDKIARGFDRVIYVLGADHHGYVLRLKAVAAMLGFDPERVEVLIYQLVNLREGGATKRVSKRRGDVVFLSELMDKIGVDAARWYLVSRGHDQAIELDVDLAAERTEKNPVYYVQYAHARIAGIMRNAASAPPATADPDPGDQERDLVKRLVDFPGIAAEAAVRRAPHMLPVYAIRVADDFHRFYHRNRVILNGDVLPFRRDLVLATRHVIASCLRLIGVEAPERM